MIIDKKIFVIGTGRCGTTWIGQWLRRHPEIFGGPETHLFEILYNLINPDWSQGMKTWLPKNQFTQEIRNFAVSCFEKCIFRNHEQKKHVVEHSCIHFNHIDFIREVFPDALFIHPYRDGRNVVESYIRTLGHNNYDQYIQKWINTLNAMLQHPRPYMLNIKYETLINDAALSRKITDFIGVDHHYDIDVWEFPVNTSLFSYDPDRWKALPNEITQKFENQEFKLLLKKLKYVT